MLLVNFAWGQSNYSDSLVAIINKGSGDTIEVDALVNLANIQTQPDSGMKLASQGLLLAEKIHYTRGKADCLFILADQNSWQGDPGATVQHALDALTSYEFVKDNTGIATAHLLLQAIYRDMSDYRKSLTHAFAGERIAEANNVIGKFWFPGNHLAPLFLAEIGQTYVFMNQLDSALTYTQKAVAQKEIFNGAEWNFPYYLLASIQSSQGNYKQALNNFHTSIVLARQNGIERDVFQNFGGMSTTFRETGQLDSAIYYAQLVVQCKLPDLESKTLQEGFDNLAELYKSTGEKDSAIKYITSSYQLRNSTFDKEKDRELQSITFKEQLKQQEILANQAKYKSKVQLFAFLGGLLVLLSILVLLWRNNRHKQIAKARIEKAYDKLKETQAQLIQSEKMASLGELTAGIAHEIQNPLNFVNNFSEVNKELLTELKDEMEKGNLDEAKSIANDVIENQEKINQHGKRADGIVKGMLQHSRISTYQKELTDINALVDEYLRLAYHGLRAKDKTFNAKFETKLDPAVGKINIVPQEIGRVILNLINNAFYAVSAKAIDYAKALSGELATADGGYEPTVTVTTKKSTNKIEISVRDNGIGIPQKLMDKIFQPFFTTKPTGQGTGLGLSLSYDIIRAHGGELKVETEEGKFSEFIIVLPS